MALPPTAASAAASAMALPPTTEPYMALPPTAAPAVAPAVALPPTADPAVAPAEALPPTTETAVAPAIATSAASPAVALPRTAESPVAPAVDVAPTATPSAAAPATAPAVTLPAAAPTAAFPVGTTSLLERLSTSQLSFSSPPMSCVTQQNVQEEGFSLLSTYGASSVELINTKGKDEGEKSLEQSVVKKEDVESADGGSLHYTTAIDASTAVTTPSTTVPPSPHHPFSLTSLNLNIPSPLPYTTTINISLTTHHPSPPFTPNTPYYYPYTTPPILTPSPPSMSFPALFQGVGIDRQTAPAASISSCIAPPHHTSPPCPLSVHLPPATDATVPVVLSGTAISQPPIPTQTESIICPPPSEASLPAVTHPSPAATVPTPSICSPPAHTSLTVSSPPSCSDMEQDKNIRPGSDSTTITTSSSPISSALLTPPVSSTPLSHSDVNQLKAHGTPPVPRQIYFADLSSNNSSSSRHVESAVSDDRFSERSSTTVSGRSKYKYQEITEEQMGSERRRRCSIKNIHRIKKGSAKFYSSEEDEEEDDDASPLLIPDNPQSSASLLFSPLPPPLLSELDDPLTSDTNTNKHLVLTSPSGLPPYCPSRSSPHPRQRTSSRLSEKGIAGKLKSSGRGGRLDRIPQPLKGAGTDKSVSHKTMHNITPSCTTPDKLSLCNTSCTITTRALIGGGDVETHHESDTSVNTTTASARNHRYDSHSNLTVVTPASSTDAPVATCAAEYDSPSSSIHEAVGLLRLMYPTLHEDSWDHRSITDTNSDKESVNRTTTTTQSAESIPSSPQPPTSSPTASPLSVPSPALTASMNVNALSPVSLYSPSSLPRLSIPSQHKNKSQPDMDVLNSSDPGSHRACVPPCNTNVATTIERHVRDSKDVLTKSTGGESLSSPVSPVSLIGGLAHNDKHPNTLGVSMIGGISRNRVDNSKENPVKTSGQRSTSTPTATLSKANTNTDNRHLRSSAEVATSASLKKAPTVRTLSGRRHTMSSTVTPSEDHQSSSRESMPSTVSSRIGGVVPPTMVGGRQGSTIVGGIKAAAAGSSSHTSGRKQASTTVGAVKAAPAGTSQMVGGRQQPVLGNTRNEGGNKDIKKSFSIQECHARALEKLKATKREERRIAEQKLQAKRTVQENLQQLDRKRREQRNADKSGSSW
eukprot:GHVQ01013441.1.p1 GENE.GHVQ01013441.1~~GHVQ01013441.1.p1  ORF type:complete len:1154 (+),score=297.75 GHVQ01013441.1:60-3521(+)